jgi:hypothetical protein
MHGPMRARNALVFLLLLTASLAGCLAEVKEVVQPPAGEDDKDALIRPFINPIVLDHEHADVAEHAMSNNVELVGREPKILPGGVGEIDTAGDHAYVALLGYGFAIVDVKDPTAPKLLSRTPVVSPDPIKYVADLKVDRTGNWVFLGMELSSTPGVLIYDATNRQAPKLAGFWASPGKLAGCHMVEYAAIGDQEFLFCAPLDAAVYIGLLTPPNAAGVREVAHVARWVPVESGFLQKEAREPAALALNVAGSGHDDMTYQLDPLSGKPTIFVSFWDLGVWFVDVSVPAAPMTLGYWNGENAKFYRGLIHTTMAFRSGDRRIVAAIPEVAVPPALFLIDATDFSKPKLLAEWKALESFKDKDGKDQSTTFSMHNFQVVEGKIYLTMYHAGIWVLDVSTLEKVAAPEPVGSYAPHEPREDGKDYGVGVWDVVLWKGYMLTADSNGGFYVLHHAADPAGDPAYTSFA